MYEEYMNHELVVYGGYVDDDNELLECASGGIATALARKMINDGGYVVGVSYSKDFKAAEYIIINEISKIGLLKGSKYIEVDKKEIYKDTKKLLNEGKKVLFFGLPCVIGALKLFLKQEYENLITCELVCHGPTNVKVHQEYIEYLEKKQNSKVINFSVRHKKKKWLPIYLYAEFENGNIFEREFYATEYGYAFDIFGRLSCYNCKFKGNNRVGDIMIGDFWGATKKDVFWNKKGTSVIFVHTEKGKAYILNTPSIKLFKTTFERAVKSNQMVIKSKKVSSEREKFSKLFIEYGLFYASKKCSYRRYKVLHYINEYIPNFLKPIAKKIYSRLKKYGVDAKKL